MGVGKSTGSTIAAKKRLPWAVCLVGCPAATPESRTRCSPPWKLSSEKLVRVETLGFGRAEVQSVLEAVGLPEPPRTRARSPEPVG